MGWENLIAGEVWRVAWMDFNAAVVRCEKERKNDFGRYFLRWRKR